MIYVVAMLRKTFKIQRNDVFHPFRFYFNLLTFLVNTLVHQVEEVGSD